MTTSEKQHLDLIIPCYNEAEGLPELFARLDALRTALDLHLELYFIDDGSTDETLELVKSYQPQAKSGFETSAHYLSFSRNFGKEAALLAGLRASRSELVALIDADLQDPPELLIEMLPMLETSDLDTVIAVRSDRKGEAWFVSLASRLFYALMKKLSKTEIISGVRDYRLMKRPVVDAILSLAEYNRFSKGLFSWVGFKKAYLPYDNQVRKSGKSKWNLTSKIKYAIDGFVNFSEAPLEIATFSGLSLVSITILAIIFLVVRQLFWHHSVNGWTSMIVIMLFCFGFVLLMLGIIGKYISNIFLETKRRPVYIIREEDEKNAK
ncbi:glycosyltransferase family 2 protein [Lactococcus termiticola]|uniref:Bactoprenol glucosyl transferase n=1 Tax=Lactococcus termiticola TaxID=2169526 RepID=A0A2R5HF50_9LACT|nr:glycosyltransferase family 2 protein [Lactococcus termiticola]GBG96683.1 bactoprenol glucosyl transferase [Lactococcus termiticola]